MNNSIDTNQPDSVLHPSVARVEAALARHGLGGRIRILDASTHTSQAAADYLGCAVEQIAKSIIFRASRSNRCVLVIASGKNRVDESRVAAALGEPLGKANAAFVKEKTGFTIGGVAPVGHLEPLVTFIDADLCHLDQLWAAAGMPNTLFSLTPTELQRIVPGHVMPVRQETQGPEHV